MPTMNLPKDQVQHALDALPDDASFDDILREIFFTRMVDRGLGESERGELVDDEEMERFLAELTGPSGE